MTDERRRRKPKHKPKPQREPELMPDQISHDCGGRGGLLRSLAPGELTQLVQAQQDVQNADAPQSLRQQQVRDSLLAFSAKPNPTAADFKDAIHNLIRALSPDQ